MPLVDRTRCWARWAAGQQQDAPLDLTQILSWPELPPPTPTIATGGQANVEMFITLSLCVLLRSYKSVSAQPGGLKIYARAPPRLD